MERIARYESEAEIGRSAMGSAVAIKTIYIHETGDDADRLRRRLLNQARTAGTPSHPGVVMVYDAGEYDEVAFIVMELVTVPLNPGT